MFCACGTVFGKPPNTQACPVCLGFPGALPVINKKALEFTIKTALALNCKISKFTKFDRKHYYYPDLPKNFQISQYDKPLSHDGYLEITAGGATKTIRLKRIHLEEDAGKLIHQEGGDSSLVDYNRSGMPLMEIVTEPDISSPEEAHEFLTKLKNILEYIEISDCNMEEGSLRCDANISVRPAGQAALGVKAEVKNLNSFKGVRQALEHEAGRQISLLEEGKKIVQETRLWNSDRQVTNSMRSKEEAHDYRYFPEPDLLPFVPDDSFIKTIKGSLPEMPDERRKRFIEKLGLSNYDAAVLIRDKKLADYFEESLSYFINPKIVANWVIGDLTGLIAAAGLSLDAITLAPKDLSGLLEMVESGRLSGKMAKEILKESIMTRKKPGDLVSEKGLLQISSEGELKSVVEKILAGNRKVIDDYKAGNTGALSFFVGQVMKETKGKANPAVVNKLLKEMLNNI